MSAFEEGQSIRLQVGKTTSHIEAKIIKLLQPWTMSAVMLVDVVSRPDGLEIPSPAILKLYDRRFSPQAREDWEAADWKLENERQLLQLSRTGAARKFMDDLEADPKFADEDEKWSVGEREMAVTMDMLRIVENEVEVYEIFKQHQGSRIPQFYAEVTVPTIKSKNLGTSPELFKVPGILIEYIDGFPLADVPNHVDQSQWNSVIDEANAVAGEILNPSNVSNSDVRPENMLVCQDENYMSGYRFVMIDFGMCHIRKKHQTDTDWGLSKLRRDEENRLGEIMQIRLKKIGFEVEYTRRSTWRKYATVHNSKRW